MLIWLPLLGNTQVGADRLLEPEYQQWFQGKRVGLITNQTGVDSRLQPTTQVLRGIPGLRLTALFAPEHGLDGALGAGESVAPEAGVFSLYGETRAPTIDMLKGLDLLVYDIQDVGARFYTFTSTLLGSMKAAARAGIPFVVLDRPDPIGGDQVEGPVLAKELESFVGIAGLPVRYAMTPGELARFLNREFDLGCDLKIVPLRGWKRSLWFDQTGLPWVPPSPNMPTVETAIVYPGFCLMEGVNLSEGRGTTKPFELIGAPWLKHVELAQRLNRSGLAGVLFRPQSFTPASSKYRGQLCHGVQVHVVDREKFEPVRTALRFLEEVRRLHPGELRFEPGFDRLVGDESVRRRLEAGETLETASWVSALDTFVRKRRESLLYH